VGLGFVHSLARPGGNVTGASFLMPEINAKRLELLKEAAPQVARVAVIYNALHPSTNGRLGRSRPPPRRSRSRSTASRSAPSRTLRRWCR
jgi:ABC transporter substrate binding protein